MERQWWVPDARALAAYLVLLLGSDVVDVHFVLGVESRQGGRQQLRVVQVVDDEVEGVMDARPESVQQHRVGGQMLVGHVLEAGKQLGNQGMSPQMSVTSAAILDLQYFYCD